MMEVTPAVNGPVSASVAWPRILVGLMARLAGAIAAAVAVAVAVALLFASPAAQAQGRAKAAESSKAKPAARARAAAVPRKAVAAPTRATPRGRVPARAAKAVRVEPPRPSFGQLAGLHNTDDPLELKSSVALVIDQDTQEVLLAKNARAVLPIASLTKLMTALVVAEGAQPLDDVLTITEADIDIEKGSRSRLAVGTQLTRAEMLHLALMSSENRAANALGRHYPGGIKAFASAMNAKAQLLGMADSDFVEPTGLSNRNRSSAKDLVSLVRAAYGHQLIREMSVSTGHQVEVGERSLNFRNTNGLIANPEWQIGLQKTGYISEAGRCLVMQAQLAGRQLILVLLDSAGRYSRLGDAERIRRWVSGEAATALIAQPR
jgi:serine-type D-Ala-D-Ala endopeptidase (penicillin-binding protein 7)